MRIREISASVKNGMTEPKHDRTNIITCVLSKDSNLDIRPV